MKILLISGHGNGDPGAIGTYRGKQYKEADMTRRVVNALAPKLREYADVDVYPQNRNAYTDYRFGELVKAANFKDYDYVLEVHFNAFEPNRDGKTKGVEIFAKGNTARETRICANIAKLGFHNRGVKSQSFAVINTARAVGAEASLLEVCFIDDEDDMALFFKTESRITDAIVEGFGLKKKVEDPNRAAAQKRFGFDDNTMRFLDRHPYPDALYKKLATKG